MDDLYKEVTTNKLFSKYNIFTIRLLKDLLYCLDSSEKKKIRIKDTWEKKYASLHRITTERRKIESIYHQALDIVSNQQREIVRLNGSLDDVVFCSLSRNSELDSFSSGRKMSESKFMNGVLNSRMELKCNMIEHHKIEDKYNELLSIHKYLQNRDTLKIMSRLGNILFSNRSSYSNQQSRENKLFYKNIMCKLAIQSIHLSNIIMFQRIFRKRLYILLDEIADSHEIQTQKHNTKTYMIIGNDQTKLSEINAQTYNASLCRGGGDSCWDELNFLSKILYSSDFRNGAKHSANSIKNRSLYEFQNEMLVQRKITSRRNLYFKVSNICFFHYGIIGKIIEIQVVEESRQEKRQNKHKELKREYEDIKPSIDKVEKIQIMRSAHNLILIKKTNFFIEETLHSLELLSQQQDIFRSNLIFHNYVLYSSSELIQNKNNRLRSECKELDKSIRSNETRIFRQFGLQNTKMSSLYRRNNYNYVCMKMITCKFKLGNLTLEQGKNNNYLGILKDKKDKFNQVDQCLIRFFNNFENFCFNVKEAFIRLKNNTCVASKIINIFNLSVRHYLSKARTWKRLSEGSKHGMRIEIYQLWLLIMFNIIGKKKLIVHLKRLEDEDSISFVDNSVCNSNIFENMLSSLYYLEECAAEIILVHDREIEAAQVISNTGKIFLNLKYLKKEDSLQIALQQASKEINECKHKLHEIESYVSLETSELEHLAIDQCKRIEILMNILLNIIRKHYIVETQVILFGKILSQISKTFCHKGMGKSFSFSKINGTCNRGIEESLRKQIIEWNIHAMKAENLKNPRGIESIFYPE